jgi:hypothetical protein
VRVDWTLLLLHIPKTAGTSVRSALERVYKPSERLYLYERASLKGAIPPLEFADLAPEVRARARLVMGHFRYGIHESIPGQSRYVTVLRDATARVLSHYAHYRSIPQPAPGTRAAAEHALVAQHGSSLEDWVFGLQRPEADNWMVRVIAGRYGVPFGDCGDEMLTEALEHIDERFEAVLLLERMGEGWRRLSTSLGVAMPTLPRMNANLDPRALDRVPASTLARIRDLNRLDHELYRRMLERLDEPR